MRTLKDASHLLCMEGNDAREAPRMKISEGRDMVTHRLKLIKLVDSSKHGWKIVDQYESDLVDDSDKVGARCDKVAREERIR